MPIPAPEWDRFSPFVHKELHLTGHGRSFWPIKVKIESKVPFSPASLAAQKARLYFIAFPTSYLVESLFSWVTYWLSKVRNRLDVVKRNDLRSSLTTMQPDISKLASVHQAQGTH
jgi:hypothetical protein